MTAQDKECFTMIYRKYYKRLLCTAEYMLRNYSISEDLTNETFEILLRRFQQVRYHPNLLGWLYTVLTNKILNEIKKQHRYPQVPLEYIKEIGYEDDLLSFSSFLPKGLSPVEAEVLYLRYQQRLNCVEIAEYLNISHNASRARLSRAKRHCAELLSKEPYLR